MWGRSLFSKRGKMKIQRIRERNNDQNQAKTNGYSIGLHHISGLFYIRYPAGNPARKNVLNKKRKTNKITT